MGCLLQSGRDRSLDPKIGSFFEALLCPGTTLGREETQDSNVGLRELLLRIWGKQQVPGDREFAALS